MNQRLFLTLTAVLIGITQSFSAPQKPNFVFLLVDDIGWGDVGCFGSTFHETPHIDQLCAQGMKFTQAYAACAVCSPSRTAILTGRYPARTHLTDWIPGYRRANNKMIIPDWTMYVDHQALTLPEALNEGGYESLFVGKWHLMPVNQPDLMKDHTPEKQGFDDNIGGREWGRPNGPGRYFYPFGMPNLEGSEGDFLTDALTDEAVGFVEDSGKNPFLLYMSYYVLHGPRMCKEKDKEYFQKKLDDSPKGTYPQTDPVYAGMAKSLDESVGRIVEAVRKKGKLNNTIFIFTGDNGGMKPSSSGGLRGSKGFSFEGGTREPTFVVWPDVVKPGSECNTPIIGMDFYPTMLEMARLPLRPTEHQDGLSLVPLLTQKGTPKRDTLYWHYPHYHKTKPYGSIRFKGWKLIEFFEDGQLMLFNLKQDPTEQNDLAKKEPEKVQELLRRLNHWRKDVDAQIMEPNPKYNSKKRKK